MGTRVMLTSGFAFKNTSSQQHSIICALFRILILNMPDKKELQMTIKNFAHSGIVKPWHVFFACGPILNDCFVTDTLTSNAIAGHGWTTLCTLYSYQINVVAWQSKTNSFEMYWSRSIK